jgi:hypothetical protein
VGIALGDDALIPVPRGDAKRTVAHEVLRLRPAVGAVVGAAETFDDMTRHGKRRRQGEDRGERRGGLGQTQHDGPVIRSADTEGCRVTRLAGVEGLGALQREQDVGVLRAELGRKHPLEGEDEIRGDQCGAVRPLQVRPQVKRPRQTVARHLPALRESRHRSRGRLVDRRQPLEQREGDRHVVVGNENLWIQVAWFRTDRQMQRTRAPPALDPRLPLSAAGEQERSGEPAEQNPYQPGGPWRQAHGEPR